MTEQRGNGERKLPGRRHLSFRDDPRSWGRHTLAARRNRPVTVIFAAFGITLLVLAGFDIAAVVRFFTGEGNEFSGAAFDVFGAIIYGTFGVICCAVALMSGIAIEEIRVGHGHMVHVVRIGFLRVFNEIDLAEVRAVRAVGHGESGDSRVCFDYGDLTLPFGSPQPGESADAAVAMIEQAIAARGGEPPPVPAIPRERKPSPTDPGLEMPAPGWMSIAFLLGANLVPVVGVLQFGWDLGQIMVLFWAENLIIGIYGLFKLAIVEQILAVISVPFFIGHFGFFMTLHFIFVYHLFVAGPKAPAIDASVVLGLLAPLWTGILAMFISHGVSFFGNFLGRREYAGRKGRDQMTEPYRRVVLLHLTIIFGGWAVLALGQPIYALLLLVALKIGMDLHAHRRERRVALASP